MFVVQCLLEENPPCVNTARETFCIFECLLCNLCDANIVSSALFVSTCMIYLFYLFYLKLSMSLVLDMSLYIYFRAV